MERLRLSPLTLPAGDAPPASQLRLSELMAALSHALDLTEGQPGGHCVRVCWIGMQIGEAIGLPERALWELYYTLLLKDLGCSSNAARLGELYLTDDRQFKQHFKQVGDRLPQRLQFILRHTGTRSGTLARLRALLHILRNGDEIAQELVRTRCQRGAEMARQLRFPAAVAEGIRSLDEHWDGGGHPEGLRGEAIPLYSRIALLSQVIDVFHQAAGPAAAVREAQGRAGLWFDPALVRAWEKVAAGAPFWAGLKDPALQQRVPLLEPARCTVALDDDYLDDIATAFGQVVDAKSRYTHGHSLRVARHADAVASALGLSAGRRRWLQRGALLHDVGKLGVSNAILDKAGPLDADEWVLMRRHATHSEEILGRISAFGELARVAGAHHERLDGRGYPRGLEARSILLESRIITVADIFDALSADRPYRAAMPIDQALDVMGGMVGSGALDPLCFEALVLAVTRPA